MPKLLQVLQVISSRLTSSQELHELIFPAALPTGWFNTRTELWKAAAEEKCIIKYKNINAQPMPMAGSDPRGFLKVLSH